MNDDTISRKAMIDAVHAATYGFICGAEDGDEMTDADELVLSINKAVCTAIKALPSVQPQRMRGKWIWKGEEGDSRFSCSVCKCRENVPTCNGIPDIWDYCPNCGCQMNGDEEDEQ